jgi:hypothetical protein
MMWTEILTGIVENSVPLTVDLNGEKLQYLPFPAFSWQFPAKNET